MGPKAGVRQAQARSELGKSENTSTCPVGRGNINRAVAEENSKDLYLSAARPAPLTPNNYIAFAFPSQATSGKDGASLW